MDQRKLYTTDFDTHNVSQLHIKELRQYAIFWLLFYDNLILSDSIINNNPYLRPLIAPHIYDFDREANPVVPDFNRFIMEGIIRPAVRSDLRNYKELRKIHEKPVSFPGLPTEQYVDYLDEISKEKDKEKYELTAVSDLFKENLINNFKVDERVLRLPQGLIETFLDYFDKQKQVNYRELRDILLYPSRYNIFSRFESQIQYYRNFIDDVISKSYKHNVPSVLGLDTKFHVNDMPGFIKLTQHNIDDILDDTTIKIQGTWLIDKDILGNISSGLVKEIKRTSEYKDFKALIDEPKKYKNTADSIWNDYFCKAEDMVKNEMASLYKHKEKVLREIKAIENTLFIGKLIGHVIIKIYIPLPNWITGAALGLGAFEIAKKIDKRAEEDDVVLKYANLTGKPFVLKSE